MGSAVCIVHGMGVMIKNPMLAVCIGFEGGVGSNLLAVSSTFS